MRNSVPRSIVALLFCMAALAGCGTSAAPSGKAQEAKNPPATAPAPTPAPVAPVTIRLAYNKTWDVAPVLVAHARNLWDPYKKIKVELVEINDGAKAVEALNAREVDAVTSATLYLISAREKRIPMVGVAALNGLSDPPQVSLVASSEIKSIKDLKGKTIGINSYGGAFDLHLRALLEANGLDPNKDVQIVTSPISAILPSIDRGQLAAGVLPPAYVTIATEQYGGKIRLLAGNNDNPAIQKMDNYQTMTLAFSDTFIKSQRAAAVDFLRGYLQAVKFIQENPKDALAVWATAAGSKEIAKWPAPPKIPADGKISVAGLDFDIQQLTKMGRSTGNLKGADMVDHSLLDEARK